MAKRNYEYHPAQSEPTVEELQAFRAAMDQQRRFSGAYVVTQRFYDDHAGTFVDQETLAFELFGPRPSQRSMASLCLGVSAALPWVCVRHSPNGDQSSPVFGMPHASDFVRIRAVGRELWRAPGGIPTGPRPMNCRWICEKLPISRAEREHLAELLHGQPAVAAAYGFVETFVCDDETIIGPRRCALIDSGTESGSVAVDTGGSTDPEVIRSIVKQMMRADRERSRELWDLVHQALPDVATSSTSQRHPKRSMTLLYKRNESSI